MARNWRTGRVKDLITSVGKGSKSAGSGLEAGKYPFFTSSQKTAFCNDWEFEGNFLLVGDGGVVNSRVATGRFGASDHTIVYRSTTNGDLRFCHYWIEAAAHRIYSDAFFGVGIKNLNRDRFAALPVLIPSLAEQQRIADYLDAETARIDALVTELTGFAELLKARDKSLISECVTQGVPHRRAGRAMKDSGIEWIGQMPEGWRTAKLGRLFRLIRGVSYSASDLGERDEPGVATMINLKSISKDAAYRPEGAKWFKGERKERHLCGSGDILIATTDLTGDRHIVGRPILIPEGLHDAVYSMDLSKVTDLRPECDARFLYFALNAETARDYAKQISPGTTVKHLDMQRFPLYSMALPPIDEQQEIATYLDEELAKSRELQEELENQVNLLKTYRKSLISEVVTGKMEV